MTNFSNGRMGLLIGLHVEAAFFDVVHPWRGHVKKLTPITKLAFRGPEFEDDIQRLRGACPDLRRSARVNAKQCEIRRNGAPANAPVKTPARQMVEHGNAVR